MTLMDQKTALRRSGAFAGWQLLLFLSPQTRVVRNTFFVEKCGSVAMPFTPILFVTQALNYL